MYYDSNMWTVSHGASYPASPVRASVWNNDNFKYVREFTADIFVKRSSPVLRIFLEDRITCVQLSFLPELSDIRILIEDVLLSSVSMQAIRMAARSITFGAIGRKLNGKDLLELMDLIWKTGCYEYGAGNEFLHYEGSMWTVQLREQGKELWWVVHLATQYKMEMVLLDPQPRQMCAS